MPGADGMARMSARRLRRVGTGMDRAVFDPRGHEVRAGWSSEKIAVLSIDVEHDYDGNRTDALDRLPDLPQRGASACR